MVKKRVVRKNNFYNKIKGFFGRFKDQAEDYFEEDLEKIKEPELSKKKERKKETVVVEFSVRNIMKITFVVLMVIVGLYAVFFLRDIITMVLISALLAVALFPAVEFFEKFKVPRVISILIVYLILTFVFSFVLYKIIPTITSQLFNLVNSFELISKNIVADPSFEIPLVGDSFNQFMQETRSVISNEVFVRQLEGLVSEFASSVGYAGGGTIGVIGNFLGSIYNLLIILVLTFFLIIDAEFVVSFIERFIPKDYREYLMTKANNMKIKVNHWVKGQIILALVVGLGFYLGLWIIQIFIGPVPFKETVAVVAGVLEIVPFIGPIITALFAMLVVVNEGIGVFLAVLVLSILIQNLENNFIVPVVMKKAVGVSSLVIFLFILIGAELYGIIGIFLAVPVIAIISVFFDDFWKEE